MVSIVKTDDGEPRPGTGEPFRTSDVHNHQFEYHKVWFIQSVWELAPLLFLRQKATYLYLFIYLMDEKLSRYFRL